MARCDVCGNDYPKSFQVVSDGGTYTFDSFECAIQQLAPLCEHCSTRIIGHGVEAGGRYFCCASCAHHEGVDEIVDNAAHADVLLAGVRGERGKQGTGYEYENGGGDWSWKQSIGALLMGASIGTTLMYFLDTSRGARRRHLVYDKAGRVLRMGRRQLHDTAENAKNHALGKIAEVKNARRERSVDDERLVQRVRAELGHRVEQARRIDVYAEDGCVTLTGYASADEIDQAERTARGVRGVRGVTNELVPRELSLDQQGSAS